MVTRCPGCAKEIEEKDESCPFCNWDFNTSAGINPMFAPEHGQPPKIPPREPYHPLRSFEEPEPITETPVQRNYLPSVLAAILAVAALVWQPKSHAPLQPARPEQLGPPSEHMLIVELAQKPASKKAVARGNIHQPRPRLPSPQRTTLEQPIIIASSGKNIDKAEEAPLLGPEWRLDGTVFDLLTLKPIDEAEMVFISLSTGQRFLTATDSSGRYRAHLPVSEEGYSLRIKHPSYEVQYAEDEDGALRRLGLAERSEFAAQVAHTLIQNETIKGFVSERTRKDFALVPADR